MWIGWFRRACYVMCSRSECEVFRQEVRLRVVLDVFGKDETNFGSKFG